MFQTNSNPRIFNILFNPADAVYRVGQDVIGQVHLVTQRPLKNITAIQVIFFGGAHVEWMEEVHAPSNTSKSSSATKRVKYQSSEEYFQSRVYAYGDGSALSTLQPGEYFFPFRFSIPPTCPASFRTEFGHTRYFARATLGLSNARDFVSTDADFTVYGHFDLNREPSAMSAQHKTSSKNFGFLMWKSGPISASIHLPKSGFVPGECIYISAEIDNKTNRDMAQTCASLVQTITFKASSREKTVSNILCETKRGKIRSNFEEIWSRVPLQIPVSGTIMPPSGLPFCSLIKLDYKLQFKVCPTGIGMDLVLELPITIGTIPVYERQDPSNSHSAEARGAGEVVVNDVEEDGFVDVQVVKKFQSPDAPPPYSEAWIKPSQYK